MLPIFFNTLLSLLIDIVKSSARRKYNIWPWGCETLGPQRWESSGAARSLLPYGCFTSCMMWKIACTPDRRHGAARSQNWVLQRDCKKERWKWLPAVTLVPRRHLQGPALLIMDSPLEEVQPTFNSNYLLEESEAREGRTSLIWNDKDGGQSVMGITKLACICPPENVKCPLKKKIKIFKFHPIQTRTTFERWLVF